MATMEEIVKKADLLGYRGEKREEYLKQEFKLLDERQAREKKEGAERQEKKEEAERQEKKEEAEHEAINTDTQILVEDGRVRNSRREVDQDAELTFYNIGFLEARDGPSVEEMIEDSSENFQSSQRCELNAILRSPSRQIIPKKLDASPLTIDLQRTDVSFTPGLTAVRHQLRGTFMKIG
ncbi:hypothetical protein PoB_005259500 [Plakobranchus ocellatus]|uniref:Uncharacterized protein n=1 Tax=Plakobranchus ocellatus TaxID=259542 RepID=A0AAV4C398_9GAST|nr:hypothetical protein PoB_005259500 [Plakobranchus ocellatus]